jgi:hypothetical protein
LFDENDSLRSPSEPLATGNDSLDRHIQALAWEISFPPLLHGTLIFSRFASVTILMPSLWSIIVRREREAKEMNPFDDR